MQFQNHTPLQCLIQSKASCSLKYIEDLPWQGYGMAAAYQLGDKKVLAYRELRGALIVQLVGPQHPLD
jgi:hypothetical protein